MQKRILYGVLNWGLGHATRSIPLITELLNRGHEVVLASDGDAFELLTEAFPQLMIEKLPSYNVKYAESKDDFNKVILKQIPHFLHVIKEEKKLAKKLCQKHGVHCIISDNRYGFLRKGFPSYFLGHQLQIKYPDNKLVELAVNKVNRQLLQKFDKILVPDLPYPQSIAEELTSNFKGEKHILGLLSSLKTVKREKIYKVCAILSGPEPQRSILEEKLVSQLAALPFRSVIVRGLMKAGAELQVTEKSDIIDFANAQQISELIAASETVICRSGYSSVMDLIKLNASAILIPTPGQTEQEYLARSLRNKKWFYSVNQDEIELSSDLENHKKYHAPEVLDLTINMTFLEN